jgi:hypothetical protein
VPLHQIFDDLFNDVESLESGKAPTSHVGSIDGHPVATVDDAGLMDGPDKVALDVTLPAQITALGTTRAYVNAYGLSNQSISSDSYVAFFDLTPDIVPAEWTTYSLEFEFYGTVKKSGGTGYTTKFDMVAELLNDTVLTEYGALTELLNRSDEFEQDAFYLRAEHGPITRATRPIPQCRVLAKSSVNGEAFNVRDIAYQITVHRVS